MKNAVKRRRIECTHPSSILLNPLSLFCCQKVYKKGLTDYVHTTTDVQWVDVHECGDVDKF